MNAPTHAPSAETARAIAAFPDVADFSDSNLYHQHYFPGAVSLFEDLDKDVMLDLRDGRKIFGTFRSFDQFANIMLERCVERLYDSASSSFFVYSPHCASSFCHSHRQYADESLGFLIVRGENVAMMGLMGAVSRPPEIVGYKLVSVSEIKTLISTEEERQKASGRSGRRDEDE